MQTPTETESNNDTEFLTKLATSIVALSWRNLVTALAFGDATSIKINFRLFAGSSGDDKIISKLNNWLLEVDYEKEKLTCGQHGTQVDMQTMKKTISDILRGKYMDIYEKLIPLMRENNYITFETYRAKPKLGASGVLRSGPVR